MPITFPCGHTFCVVCKEQLQKGGSTIRCPNDKQNIDARNLKPAYDMMTLIEEHNQALRTIKANLEKEMIEKMDKLLIEDEKRHENLILKIREEEEEKMKIELRESREQQSKKIESDMKSLTTKHLKDLENKLKNGRVKLPGFDQIQNRRRNNIEPESGTHWYWQKDDGYYLRFQDNVSKSIESAWRSGRNSFRLPIKQHVKIDFTEWKEIDQNGAERNIKRINNIRGPPIWKIMTEPHNWIILEDRESFELEQAWLKKEKHFRLESNLGNLLIDFLHMKCTLSEQEFPITRDTINY